MRKVAVIGAGAFGTAIAHVLGSAGCAVSLGVHSAEEEEHGLATTINTVHENTLWLPGYEISHNVSAVPSFGRALASSSDGVFWALPSEFFGSVVDGLSPLPAKSPHVILSKGLVLRRDQALLPLEVLLGAFVGEPSYPISVLAGPTFAAGLMENELSLLQGAGCSPVLDDLQERLGAGGSFLRIEQSEDAWGVGLCAALKTVYAIGGGLIRGVAGPNTRALYVMRSVHEMDKFVKTFGGLPGTAFGPAGLGDFVLTATLQQSRNCAFGELLGSGMHPREAIATMGGKTVEGLDVLKRLPLFVARALDVPQSNDIGFFLHVHFPILGTLLGMVLNGETAPSITYFLGVVHSAS